MQRSDGKLVGKRGSPRTMLVFNPDFVITLVGVVLSCAVGVYLYVLYAVVAHYKNM